MKKLFFSLMALCLGLSASAATEITSGTSYYIQNVESGLFMGGANNWGTRGSVSVDGEMFTATSVSDGVYTLKDVVITSGYLGSNIYTDNGTAQNWTITAVDGEDGVFTISNGTSYLAQSTEAGSHIGYVLSTATEVTSAAKWYFLTADEAKAKLNAATKDVPVDATFLIANANFSRMHNTSVWTVSASNKNLAGGSNDNMCAESYRSTFDISQTLAVPNGVYELTAQAALTDYTNVYDGTNYPVVYANSESAVFNSMDESDRGTNMSTLSTAFTKGTYAVGPVKVTVTDGTLKVGVKGTRTDTWCIFDNFQLKYYGVDLDALQENLNTRAAYAQTLTGKMNTTVASNLAAAITAAQGCAKELTALETATTNLETAISAAEASIAVYTSVAAINTKAEALTETGKAAYATTLEAYEAGTLKTVAEAETAFRTATLAQTEDGADFTGAIVNPDFETGNIDGWTDTYTAGNHGFQNNNSYTNGEASCKNFMECWVWSGGSNYLADGKLSQTLTNLPAGNYTLSADLISVQQGATVDQTGVYVFATCAAGTFKSDACSTANGVPQTFSFTFNTTEGNCELGLMTQSTNCNWVAFDNVKLIRNKDVDPAVVYQMGLKAVIDEATDPETIDPTADETMCDQDVYDAYNKAYAAAVAAAVDGNTQEAYAAARHDLEIAEAALAESQAAYAPSLSLRQAIERGTAAEGVVYTDGVDGWDYTPAEENNGMFHTNTWSGEGAKDGTGMTTSFGEYWIAAGNTLTDATIAHKTMKGLKAGNYAVSTLVRYYNENGGETSGVYFGNQDVASLTDVTYNALQGKYGVITEVFSVGEDGNLDFGFSVEYATGNWLAWKGLTIKYLGEKETDAEATVAVTEAGYGTFYAPYVTAVPEGAKAYTVSGTKDEDGNGNADLVMTEVTGMIPANTPVIVAAKGATISTETAGVAYKTVQPSATYVLTGVLEPTKITSDVTNTTCVLQNQTNGVGFYAVAQGAEITVPANRAYLTVATPEAARFYGFGGDETAINTVNALTSGKASIYDLNGRQLQKLQKGINIINGVKVLVK